MAELKHTEVYKKCDLSNLGFKNTDEIGSCDQLIGQDRAVRALNFGLGMNNRGYHIYIAGRSGVGKSTSVKHMLESISKDKPQPFDWCYVYNFIDPTEPKAFTLPTGTGKLFKKDMEDFIELLKENLPKAFETKEYEEERQNLTNIFQRDKNILFDNLQEFAKTEEMQVQFTPTGIVTIPIVGGKPITQEDYAKLDDSFKEIIRKRKEVVENEISSVVKKVRKMDQEFMDKVKELEQKVALFAVQNIVDNLREKYTDKSQILEYLAEVQKHILDNIYTFLPDRGSNAPPGFPLAMPKPEPTFTEYKVNVFIDNSNTEGAPVIFETHPTYTNLFGSIEREARFGALVTDFTMIHAGSIAKANGGYLVVEANDLFKYPLVWDSLKKVLENRELRIEDVSQHYGLMSTMGMRPEPMELNVKVIIMGNPQIYNLLYTYDEDFRKLFKVKADFDSVVKKDDDILYKYCCLIKSIGEKENLKTFDRSGVEAILEYSTRLAGDQDKLSVQFGAISKIIKEANYWSEVNGNNKNIKRADVERAIDEMIYRSNMIEEKIREMITDGNIMISTSGQTVGQINGLAVYNMGDYAFGKPNRITCETYIGAEGLINIERRAKLSGNIHDKGVLILNGYLGAKYAQDIPLSLSASLGFEQTYEMIDGDSASAAELVALLSSLSEIPIKQCFAITGSVNQKGQIQPIGGVNEKVEGFFHVCKEKGLNGENGVLIPHQNVQNLMLKKEVIEAVKNKKFHIHSIETIEDALQILTGTPAGQMLSDGSYKEGTVNYLVSKKLKQLAEEYRKSVKGAKNTSGGGQDSENNSEELSS
ncbi:MAG TPA: AAA family ATPase [Thermodesulfobacteriota bacterium]|nr:AAA family ATPase [Thermodesulfobacteriota bacterium]